MRFEVEPEALVRDSGRFGEAARALDGVDVSGAIEPVARAFPGGMTAAAIREVGALWSDRLLRVRLGLGSLSAELENAGESYDVVEQVTRRALLGRGDLP